MTEKKRVGVSLNKQNYSYLVKLADQEQRSLSNTVNFIVAEHRRLMQAVQ